MRAFWSRTNQQLSTTARDQTDLKKTRPELEDEITRTRWIEHVTKLNTYKDPEGKSTLPQSIERDLHDYIAKYIFDDSLAVMKTLIDQEITVLLNTFSRVGEAVDIKELFRSCH